MRSYQTAIILVSLLLLTVSLADAKRKKNKSSDSSPSKTKTKTKWSTSTDLGEHSHKSMIATEEHGYYVKRTFLPLNDQKNDTKPQSPPFLAVPIVWFPCNNPEECMNQNSLAINSNKNSLSQGFLCDDDCIEPYEPICGKTSTEIAVFYNKCKLNVAKCRSHGLWMELNFKDCESQYPSEVKYADAKFRANPFFKEQKKTEEIIVPEIVKSVPEIKKDIELRIKEIHDKIPVTKLKDTKDHYEQIKTDSKESSEEKIV